MNSKRQLLFAIILLVATGARAVSSGTALFTVLEAARASQLTRLPRPVSLREVRGRGLLANVWINSLGPFTFAVDTGAGATLVSSRLAAAARLQLKAGRSRSIAGLSGQGAQAHDTTLQTLAVGDRDNYVPGSREIVVTSGLPSDLDGVLDPTEAFSPLGYVIDIPRLQLWAFNPREAPITARRQPADGAVVPWVRERQGRRPFVQLDNGDRALIDTGSYVGLAITAPSAVDRGPVSYTRDIGGGKISTRRVPPTTVAIGALTLRNIPTDVISGAEAYAPVLLGLSALRPFRIAFDPLHRLIEIVPADRRARS